MKQGNSIAGVIKALSCLVVAFALVFSTLPVAHAAQGYHAGHSKVEQSDSHAADSVHAQATTQMECGTSTDKPVSDAGPHQCCAEMCVAAILVDVFATPLINAMKVDPIVLHSTLVAADASGLLRPPKHLI